MLPPPLPSRSVIYIVFFMLRFCSASQPLCNAGIYGIPSYRDCLSARHSMPFAVPAAGDRSSRRWELWAEPQFLRPPFSAINNRYRPLPINQLPKIWRYSTLITTFPLRVRTSKPRELAIASCHGLTRGFPDTCRLALMSHGRSGDLVTESLWTASWRVVQDQMQTLFLCASPRSGIGPSGGYKALISTWLLPHSWIARE